MSSVVSHRLEAAAAATGVSVKLLKKAIHATDPNAFPPPLKAKRLGTEKKFVYLVTDAELTRWVNALADA